MDTFVNEYTFPSSSGLADIYAFSFAPDNPDNVKGVVQICHGMAEHSARYADFAKFLSENGYAVFINDHLGHGKSVAAESELGYFGDKSGDHDLVSDAKLLTDIAKNEYPDKPFFIFGHSMGSFIARSYAEKFGIALDGAIFCGTSGANPAAGAAIKIAQFVAARKGTHHRSELINKVAFGSYNKRIAEPKTPFDWLTRDSAVVEEYMNDPLCGFLFTAPGYRDLFTLLRGVSQSSWYANIPYILPILLISGKDDPVGEYGKGVRQVFRDLKKSGHGSTQMKLYDGCRHEILNELNKAQVYDDVLEWLNSNIQAEKTADEGENE